MLYKIYKVFVPQELRLVLGKQWPKILFCIRVIFIILRKQVIKQKIGGVERNSEIVAISNRYKSNFDDLFDYLDPESPNWL